MVRNSKIAIFLTKLIQMKNLSMLHFESQAITDAEALAIKGGTDECDEVCGPPAPPPPPPPPASSGSNSSHISAESQWVAT